MMRKGQKKDICPLGYWNPTVDHPELMVNATEEPRKTVADLIRTEMFHYAKSNMALVNIYIKVSKINWKMLIDAVYLHTRCITNSKFSSDISVERFLGKFSPHWDIYVLSVG